MVSTKLHRIEFSFAQGTNEDLSEEGSGQLPFSDDEDFGMAGSGSGDGGMDGANGSIIIYEPRSHMTAPPRRSQPPTRSLLE